MSKEALRLLAAKDLLDFVGPDAMPPEATRVLLDGYPVIGDAFEAPGGYFLTGHPTNITIMHWFKIRGYYSSGAGTDYEDSESGAESLSGWTVGSVPKYSPYDTGRLLQILGERGYIW